MTLLKRRTSLLAGGVALALGLAACGGGGDDDPQAGGNQAPTEGQKGGVLKVLNEDDFEHLDPQRNYVNTSGNAGRLITRTLTIIKEEPEKEPEVVGDLAEKWESSDNNQTWTFTLKDNLKYEDGTPVTAADVKYGVERSFSPDLAEGAPYARQYLVGAETYKGPYVNDNNGGKGLESIQAPDEKTVVFKLNQPVSDFQWTASTATFSPVPPAKDTKTLYDNKPISTGPYKVESYNRDQSLVLVRNEHWDQSTDPVRTALPDRFEFSFGQDPAVVDQRLIADSPADQNAISSTVTVQNQSLGKLQQPDVKDRVVSGAGICVRYVAINMQKPAMQDVRVRQALQYAVNKRDFQTAYGGELFGPIINSVIPPDAAGFRDVTLYEAAPTGNPEKAKQLLAEAGASNLAITLDSSDSVRATAAAVAVQNALQRAGITVTINKIPGANFYTTIQNDAQAHELMTAGWCADWPSSSSILPPVFGPDNMLQPSRPNTNNFSRYQNNEVWAEMRRISTEVTDEAEAAEAWADLNERVMQDAPLIPTINDSGVFVHGSKVTNVVISPTWGGYIDLVKIGVAQ
jgi:peptide/nickel transport system substrate-binding protein